MKEIQGKINFLKIPIFYIFFTINFAFVTATGFLTPWVLARFCFRAGLIFLFFTVCLAIFFPGGAIKEIGFNFYSESASPINRLTGFLRGASAKRFLKLGL